MSHPNKEFLERYLKPLVGATVESVGANDDEDGYEPWPTITVRAADGRRYELEISRDEEGNGPGFVFGLPMPEPEEVPA